MIERNINGEVLRIPEHVAIIMDGNGRWAKQRNRPRTFGHSQGSKNLEKVCKAADELGIRVVTVYAFSTENWSRPLDEVNMLMDLLRIYLKDSIKKSKRNNMRVKVIGDKRKLDATLIERINVLEEETKDFTGLTLNIALNYGSRDEIIRSMKKLFLEYKNDKIDIEDITEDIFNQYLDTNGLSDPDLLIRTSGEQRLSNFLLWQLAYTEFYFSDVYWPDFNKEELIKAISHYNKRERRFGSLN